MTNRPPKAKDQETWAIYAKIKRYWREERRKERSKKRTSRKEKKPKEYEKPNIQVLFASSLILNFVIQSAFNLAIPIASRIFGTLLFSYFAFALVRWDFNEMCKRRLLLEQFLPEESA